MPPLLTTLTDTARHLLRRFAPRFVSPTRPTPAEATPAVPAPAAEPAPPRAKNWELATQAELVAHIEDHYHAGLRRELPRLIDGARKVERDHASHPAVPAGLCDLLAELYAELDSHMQKEEAMLFPVLRGGVRTGGPNDMPLDMPMRMMEREHDSHADQLDRIRELTRNRALPAEACATWQALYAGLATLETDLRQHIYLENNVLFARASRGA